MAVESHHTLSRPESHRHQRHRQTQRLFVGLLAVFLLYLAGSAAIRSFQRRSMVGSDGTESSTSFDVVSAGSSEVHLQDFHRVEVRNGKPIWEVRAKDAKYYREEGVTHVSNVLLTIYRASNSTITVVSERAKLFLTGASLRKAILEGNIVVNMDDSVFTEMQLATYDVELGRIIAPGAAKIRGTGFETTGEEMEVVVEAQNVTIRKNVSSRFEPGAKVPASVQSLGKDRR